MNKQIGSIVANRMYAFGESYAQAKAWAVANLAGVGADIDNVQADITTLGGQALEARAVAWYDRDTLFATLPASSPNATAVPGFNLQGQEGNAVLVKNGAFALATAGGGGLSGFAAVGSTPNANGGSVSGSNIILQPADATHPGVVTAGSQTFGGAKVIGGCTLSATLSFACPGISFGANAFVGTDGAGGTVLGTTSAGSEVQVWMNGSTRVGVKETNLDMTGFGVGGSIKLKSPDGTTYTISVANGGTLSIV
jgi:hypothetical protein